MSDENSPQAPVSVRIDKISICDFRAFPGPEVYEFVLNGRNLLLWGENGSGKTSFTRALQALLDPVQAKRPFDEYKNRFSDGAEPFDEGVITIELGGFTPNAYSWKYGEERPNDDSFQQIANRATFLDYKSLLRMHHVGQEDRINLFDLMVNSVLRYATYPASSRTFSEEWESLRQMAVIDFPDEDSSDDDDADTISGEERLRAAADEFRNNLAAYLETLEDRANNFLQKFLALGDGPGDDTVIRLSMPEAIAVTRVGPPHDFSGMEVNVSVTYAGIELKQPDDFLNEARLSAFAISLYLAAALQATTPARAVIEDVTYELPRLLVLDDILIGLDLSHRMPLLNILQDHFGDWQIILTTFDRVWFELAGLQIRSVDWQLCEMVREHQTSGSVHFDVPLVTQFGSAKSASGNAAKLHFLDHAEKQLASGNWRAAAMYARVAFEAELKHTCHTLDIPVPYKDTGKYPDTDEFLNAIKDWLNRKREGTYVLYLPLLEHIGVYRKRVLNPMTHYTPLTLANNEIRQAIAAVRQLDLASKQQTSATRNSVTFLRDTFSRLNPASGESNAIDLLEAVCLLRATFEAGLWEFCKEMKIPVPFTGVLDKMGTTVSLWEGAKVYLLANTAVDASPFVGEIDSHRSWLVEDARIEVLQSVSVADARQALAALFEGTASADGNSKLRHFKSQILRERGGAG